MKLQLHTVFKYSDIWQEDSIRDVGAHIQAARTSNAASIAENASAFVSNHLYNDGYGGENPARMAKIEN